MFTFLYLFFLNWIVSLDHW